MREIIRFARGSSYLGNFLVAFSQRGVVACEFGLTQNGGEDELKKRFPEADLVADQEGLTDVIKKISRRIEDPKYDPQLPFDVRGVPYQLRIWWRYHQIQAPGSRYRAIALKLESGRAATTSCFDNVRLLRSSTHRTRQTF